MKDLTPAQKTAIEDAARQACRHAYAPYSHFPVGAAVLTDNGRIVTGCNVENASLGLSCCAERVALFNAVSQGHRRIIALAIYTPTATPTSPCGACRQMLEEFAADAVIISVCQSDKRLESAFADLLPMAFSSIPRKDPKA